MRRAMPVMPHSMAAHDAEIEESRRIEHRSKVTPTQDFTSEEPIKRDVKMGWIGEVVKLDGGGALVKFPELDGSVRVKSDEFEKLQVVGAPARPLGPVCTSRTPKVGDRVMSTHGDAHTGDWRDHDAWTLNAGDVATVKEVSTDGERFKLTGGHGQEGAQSSWAKPCYYSYADAE